MRTIRRTWLLALGLALGACGGQGEEQGPPAPVQGGEALQVETDPAATDTTPVGAPGVTVQTDSQ